jgi:uncharacterized protein (TIGR00369 family)
VSTEGEQKPRAALHLDALKAGRADFQPVVKTMRLGGIVDWKPGWIRKVWKPSPDLLAVDGTVFGGYLAALADQALAFAAMTVLPNDRMFRTISLSVNFYRLSRNEDLTIDATVTAQSQQVISVEAEFRNPAGELVAKATAQQVVTSLPATLRAGAGGS